MKRASFLIPLLPLLISSCSIKIPLNNGRIAYIGMVTIHQSSDEGHIIRHTQRLGVAADIGLNKTGALLGYEDEYIATPKPGSVTHIDYSYKRLNPFSKRLNIRKSPVPAHQDTQGQ